MNPTPEGQKRAADVLEALRAASSLDECESALADLEAIVDDPACAGVTLLHAMDAAGSVAMLASALRLARG